METRAPVRPNSRVCALRAGRNAVPALRHPSRRRAPRLLLRALRCLCCPEDRGAEERLEDPSAHRHGRILIPSERLGSAAQRAHRVHGDDRPVAGEDMLQALRCPPAAGGGRRGRAGRSRQSSGSAAARAGRRQSPGRLPEARPRRASASCWRARRRESRARCGTRRARCTPPRPSWCPPPARRRGPDRAGATPASRPPEPPPRCACARRARPAT